MHIRITSIEVIDTNKPADLFVNSDANGIAVCIREVAIYKDDGTFDRVCKLNDDLLKMLKTVKIQVK